MKVYYTKRRKVREEKKRDLEGERKGEQIIGPGTILGAFTYIISFTLQRICGGGYYYPILQKRNSGPQNITGRH